MQGIRSTILEKSTSLLNVSIALSENDCNGE